MADFSVTWLLPVKDGDAFLEDCLSSIESQTYKDWQVLALDDGSKDTTLNILSQWIPARIPGRIISRESKGLGFSLAQLVQESTTELCARIDHDDLNAPQRLQLQVDYMASHCDVAVLGSYMYVMDEEANKIRGMMTAPTEPDDILNKLLSENPIFHPSVMFRRSMVLQAGNYHAHKDAGFDNYSFFEDWELWIRMAAKYKLANLPEPLVYYRVTKASLCNLTDAAGLGKTKSDETIKMAVEKTFGIEKEAAIRLRDRQTLFALPLLIQIASHLEKDNFSRWAVYNRLRMPSFILMAKNVVKNTDVVSRLVMSYFELGLLGVFGEISLIARQGIGKLYRRISK